MVVHVWAALAAFQVQAAGTGGRAVPASLRTVIEGALAGVEPALVRIEVVAASYGDGREVKHQGSGSGVIITKEGHIITNHHVAGHAVRLICTLADNEEIPAELVGSDPLADIAIIKLQPPRPREFPVAEFGDSDLVKVGDYVLAMG